MWKPHTHVTTKSCWTCIIRAFRIEFMCIFSVWKLFCTCGEASYVRFGKTKDKHFNRSLRRGTEMRHRNLRSDSVHTGYIGTGCHIGTGFRYPTLPNSSRYQHSCPGCTGGATSACAFSDIFSINSRKSAFIFGCFSNERWSETKRSKTCFLLLGIRCLGNRNGKGATQLLELSW